MSNNSESARAIAAIAAEIVRIKRGSPALSISVLSNLMAIKIVEKLHEMGWAKNDDDGRNKPLGCDDAEQGSDIWPSVSLSAIRRLAMLREALTEAQLEEALRSLSPEPK